MSEQLSCGNCAFFLEFDEEKTAHIIGQAPPPRRGFCRRNPPTPITIPMQRPAAIAGAAPEIQIRIEPAFAPTQQSNWCGEHMTVQEYVLMKTGDDLTDELTEARN